MTRVLFLTPNWLKPSEQFVQCHIDMLIEAGVLTVIVTNDSQGDTRYNGIPVLSLYEKNLQATIKRSIDFRVNRIDNPTRHNKRIRLQKIVADYQPDVIFCEFGTQAVDMLGGVDWPCRVVVHLHGYDTYDTTGGVYQRELIELSRQALILCNSDYTKQRMLNWGISPDRLITKTIGVQVPPAPPTHPPQDRLTIVHMGRLIPLKGPVQTLKAFELASQQGLNAELIIAGGGDLLPELQQLRAASSVGARITLTGTYTPEQAEAWFSQAHIFTLHARHDDQTGRVEAFGLTPVEAMAHALPVVSNAIGGITETVVDGVTGFLNQPDDISAQAQSFLTLANDAALRERMGIAGWERARTYFSGEIEQHILLGCLQKA